MASMEQVGAQVILGNEHLERAAQTLYDGIQKIVASRAIMGEVSAGSPDSEAKQVTDTITNAYDKYADAIEAVGRLCVSFAEFANTRWQLEPPVVAVQLGSLPRLAPLPAGRQSKEATAATPGDTGGSPPPPKKPASGTPPNPGNDAENETPPPAAQPKLAGREEIDSIPQAPTMDDVANDPTRTDQLVAQNEYYNDDTQVTITEREAVQELKETLQTMIEQCPDPDLCADLESISESLNFIGKQEIDAACAAIAQNWNEYLEQNPGAQILVAPGYSRLGPGDGKSDDMLLDNVLGRLDTDQLQGRLVSDINQLTADPSQTRVVLLEDWTLSGTQLDAAAHTFARENSGNPHLANLEVNLVLAPKALIEQGYAPGKLDRHDGPEHNFAQPIPVKSCYVARPAQRSHPDSPRAQMHVASAHTVPDYQFSTPIELAHQEIKHQHETQGGPPPPSQPYLSCHITKNKPPGGYTRVNRFLKSPKKPR